MRRRLCNWLIRLLRKLVWFLCVLAGCVWLIVHSTTTQQPDLTPQFYSNQVGHDIRHTLVRAIEKSQNSVYLVMFGLSDPAMLRAIAEQCLPTTVYYDPVGSPALWNTLSEALLYP